MERMRSISLTALFFFPGSTKPRMLADGPYRSLEEFVRSCMKEMYKLSGSLVQGKIVVRTYPAQQGREELTVFIRSNDSIYDQLCAHFEKFFDAPK